jgi:two-component system, OmpR family, KDP operon response regulator KdpE
MTSAMHALLIVEDEPALRGMLVTTLEAENYRIIEAGSAGRALTEARTHRPDLILLDLGLPDRDGLEVITEVREWSAMPIVVLSARSQEEQKILALDAGADDYITKPFTAGELLARVRAALRRGAKSGESAASISIGDIQLDLARRHAERADGVEVHLTPVEFRLLECLARNAGMVVTHRKLLKEVWGPDRIDQTQYLRVYMKTLREKLEQDPARPRHLVTEIGIGYRLEANYD